MATLELTDEKYSSPALFQTQNKAEQNVAQLAVLFTRFSMYPIPSARRERFEELARELSDFVVKDKEEE